MKTSRTNINIQSLGKMVRNKHISEKRMRSTLYICKEKYGEKVNGSMTALGFKTLQHPLLGDIPNPM